MARYNLWVWEQPWRVLSTYLTKSAAQAAARRAADPPDTWCITQSGDVRDDFLRDHCDERDANKASPK